MPVTAKQRVQELLDTLPDDASLEDIEYRIYLQAKVDQGLSDIAAGRVLDQEEVERRMARWLSE